MAERKFPKGFGTTMNRKRVGGKPVDKVGRSSGGAGTPHPNGGEVRRMPLNQDPGKMPADMSSNQVTHTPLEVGEGNAGLGKMPRRMQGARQTQPVRR